MRGSVKRRVTYRIGDHTTKSESLSGIMKQIM